MLSRKQKGLVANLSQIQIIFKKCYANLNGSYRKPNCIQPGLEEEGYSY